MKRISIIILVTAAASSVYGQSPEARPTQEAVKNLEPMYQIFLAEPAGELVEIIMMDENRTPVDGYLNSEKTSIIIRNWDEKSGIKYKLRWADGREEERTVSKCHIDAYIPDL